MTGRTETPQSEFRHLVAGHFHAERGYFAYRSRGTKDWLLVHTLSGCGRFGFTHGETTAQPRDIVLLPPGTLHDYGIHPDHHAWELQWVHFHPRPHWHDLLAWPDLPDPSMEQTGLLRLRLPKPNSARVASRLSDMLRLANTPQRNGTLLAMNALEEVLLWCDEWNPSHHEMMDPRIQAAMELMCRKLDEPLRIETLANAAGLSPSRFSHLFRALAGTTPQRYHEQRRLDRACRLLEMTSMPMKAIARDLGFDNAFYFSRRFSIYARCSPSEYRRRAASKRSPHEQVS
jgi:AraC family transcriptional regulator, arabinose operon regulatory protein